MFVIFEPQYSLNHCRLKEQSQQMAFTQSPPLSKNPQILYEYSIFTDIEKNDVTIGAALNSCAVVTGQDALTCPAGSMVT